MQEYVTSKIRVHYFLRIDVYVAFSPMLLSCGFSFSLLGNPHGYSHADAQTGDSGDRAKATGNPVGESGPATGPGSDVSSN